jgi:hypothetical protein
MIIERKYSSSLFFQSACEELPGFPDFIACFSVAEYSKAKPPSAERRER